MWPTILDLDLPFWPHELTLRSYGLMLMIGFLVGTWWATRRAERVKADPELIINMGFVALLSSIIGARLFYVIHYWDDHFAGRGWWAVVNITSGGLEFYGGFIGAFSALLIYLWRRRVSLRLYLDIIAPSIAFGLAVTRIGCFLNGCCWGGACPETIPWAVQFPYQSSAFDREWRERLTAVPAPLIGFYASGEGHLVDALSDDPLRKQAITDQAARYGLSREQLAGMTQPAKAASPWLHPVQLYSSIDAAVLAVLLNALFYRRKRHGILAGLFLILYPIMRYFEETIRMDNPHDTAGLTISQFVSVVLLVMGVAYMIVISRLPLRSPRAVAYVPPMRQAEQDTSKGKPMPAKARAGAARRPGR